MWCTVVVVVVVVIGGRKQNAENIGNAFPVIVQTSPPLA